MYFSITVEKPPNEALDVGPQQLGNDQLSYLRGNYARQVHTHVFNLCVYGKMI